MSHLGKIVRLWDLSTDAPKLFDPPFESRVIESFLPNFLKCFCLIFLKYDNTFTGDLENTEQSYI